MMRPKKPSLVSHLIAIGSLMLAGIAIVGMTIYLIFYFNEPESIVAPDVSPATNNIPFPGRTW